MNGWIEVLIYNLSYYHTMGPILIALTTRSYALTSDATGVANAIWLF